MTEQAADNIRAMTLGAWLEIVDTRGWVDERAWLIVRDAAVAAMPAVRGRLRAREEEEELVSDAVALARTVPASWRRPARNGVALVRWIAGVMKRLALAMRRREFTTVGDRVLGVEAPAPEERESCDDPEPPLVDPAAVLTAKQLAAWRAYCRGSTAQAAAYELGISRDAYRDRRRRAAARLRSGVPAPAQRNARAMVCLAMLAVRSGQPQHAVLLLLRGAGESHRRCAEALRISVEAVRSRIARLWRMWNPSLTEERRDTDLPRPTLAGRELPSLLSERGATGGVPHEAAVLDLDEWREDAPPRGRGLPTRRVNQPECDG